MKKIFFKLLISLSSLVFILAAIELFLRLFQLSPNYIIKYEWHEYRKNIINSLGFRDIEHTIQKPDNTFRIMFVGDSFTEAWGVPFEKGFPQILTNMLNQSARNKHYEPIICAKWGHNTKEELRTYKTKCAQFNPDLIIIGYVLNDAEGEKTSKERKEFLYSLRIKKPKGILLKAYNHLAIYRFFHLRKEYIRIRTAWIKGYDKIYSGSQSLLQTQQALIEFKRIADANNQKLVVALLPTLDYELNDNNPFIKYYKIMLNFLRQNGINACYVYPYFNGKNTIELQVNPGYDSHPNEEGHRIIAKAIYECLQLF